MAKYEQHDFMKEIYWINEETGRRYEWFATYDVDDGIVALRDDTWAAFDLIEQDDIENGMTLEEIFDDIPEDVTDFRLK